MEVVKEAGYGTQRLESSSWPVTPCQTQTQDSLGNNCLWENWSSPVPAAWHHPDSNWKRKLILLHNMMLVYSCNVSSFLLRMGWQLGNQRRPWVPPPLRGQVQYDTVNLNTILWTPPWHYVCHVPWSEWVSEWRFNTVSATEAIFTARTC